VRRAARLPLEQLQPYLLDPPLAEAGEFSLRWSEVFGNDHPVEMEVGCGKGLFLLNAAGSNPHVNYVGIEIERKYVLFTAGRVAKRGLSNLRLVCGDARVFLRDIVPAASLHALHVYFPDPWWKNRHRKRRVFTEEFARTCARVLHPGGRLHVATDVDDYFAVITAMVAREARLTQLPPPEVRDPEHDLDYLTNFERKYRRVGRAIFRATYEQPPVSPAGSLAQGGISTAAARSGVGHSGLNNPLS
jgi:tRNA (guanine-N7-)-methyltransferase